MYFAVLISAATFHESFANPLFNEAVKSLNQIDLSKVIEMDDNTALMDQAACAGGACEII